jgi:methylmalonyl-CoA/ethylmalonyl-CoA epimerase
MTEIKRIHHVAILVKDLDASLSFWRDILGLSPASSTDVPEEGARITFLPIGESQVELVQPTTSNSGLSRYLDKHGPGIHHLCLEVADLSEIIARLKSKQVRLINDEPKIGTDGRRYIFIHPESTYGVLIELYQLPP